MSTEEKLDPRSMNTFTMPAEQETLDGVVRVHESVLCSIVRKSACSVPGVVRLDGGSFVDSLAEIVGRGKHSFEKSILVEMGESAVAIEVRIVVAFGANALEVGKAVSDAITSAVVEMTGMTVSKVTVLVMDFEEEVSEDSGME